MLNRQLEPQGELDSESAQALQLQPKSLLELPRSKTIVLEPPLESRRQPDEEELKSVPERKPQPASARDRSVKTASVRSKSEVQATFQTPQLQPSWDEEAEPKLEPQRKRKRPRQRQRQSSWHEELDPEIELDSPGEKSGPVLQLALCQRTTSMTKPLGVVGVRRRIPQPYPEFLPEDVTPASTRTTQLNAKALESTRLRSSVFSSPEARQLRQLRGEGKRLVSPLQLNLPQRQLSTSDARSPCAGRLQLLRKSHARAAAMRLQTDGDSRDMANESCGNVHQRPNAD